MFKKVSDAVDFESIPIGPIERWVALKEVAEKIALEEIDDTTSKFNQRKTILDFAGFLEHVANSLEIEVVIPPVPDQDKLNTRTYFLSVDRIQAELERIVHVQEFDALLSGKGRTKSEDLIQISNRAVVEIHNKLGNLRNSVMDLIPDEKKKIELLDLLNEFEIKLNRKKVSKKSALATMAFVAAGLGGATAFFADAPEAAKTIGEITAVIGAEIVEDERRKALPPIKNEKKLLSSPPEDGSIE